MKEHTIELYKDMEFVRQLPYYRELQAIGDVLKGESQKGWSKLINFMKGPCVDIARVINRFVPELQPAGGIYTPIAQGHAFNQDPGRKLYVDLTMWLFAQDLISKFDAHQECKRTIKFFEENQNDPDKEIYLRENKRQMEGLRRGGQPILCGIVIDNTREQDDFSVYESEDEIPHLPIPEIAVMPSTMPILQEYPQLTRAVRSLEVGAELDYLVELVEAELQKTA